MLNFIVCLSEDYSGSGLEKITRESSVLSELIFYKLFVLYSIVPLKRKVAELVNLKGVSIDPKILTEIVKTLITTQPQLNSTKVGFNTLINTEHKMNHGADNGTWCI